MYYHSFYKWRTLVVLISFLDKKFDLELNFLDVDMADSECLVGVVGTRYWRALEILQAMQQGDSKLTLNYLQRSQMFILLE